MPSKKNALKLPPALLTVAEKSDYKATSKYDDVRAFLCELKAHSSQMTLHSFGKTTEGRDLLMAVFSDKPIYSHIQALKSPKPIALLQNNIHAGEVCPKEASMMLMRELVFGDLNKLLKHLIVLVIPIYNADGNERVSEANRLSQVGPETGVGVRTNALGLDLNRDYMKIEAQETAHLIHDVYVKWSPDIIIDGHTTDGSRHGYDLTYGFPQNPNAYKKLIDFTRDVMLPAVREKVKKDAGIETFYYADFVDFRNPEKGWATYSHHARYGASYGGLQNRIAILMETYSYIPFKRRIEAAYRFMRECLEFAARNAKTIKDLVREAEADAIERGEIYDPKNNVIGIEIEKVAFEKPVTVIGYEIKEKKNPDGSVVYLPTTKKKLYRAPYFGKFRIARSVPSPLAYLLPKAERRIARKLRQHGVAVEVLLSDFVAKVERFEVKDVKVSEQCFQGHREATISVERVPVEMTFRAGDFVVPMSQPASRVVAGLLEPDSDDSLAHWNYFDNYLTGKLRYEKDFVLEYEYNLIDLPRTREIYEKLIDKNPALSDEQKQAEKMKFFMTAVGYENEFMNQIPVYRLVERGAYSAMVVASDLS
ncbi:MAG: M14 family metallopeptidase [Chloroherpetonaceae bacterium]|nr:M14 family metallopeptidase [Chloroherpetonaceae bacterium]MDW8436878.1 M14 family metallopeptidase [Chloroherpetonaceae bacterium]